MSEYKLVFTDQTENSILRRRLCPWADSDADGARSVVHAVLEANSRNEYKQDQFQWETHVYPLFYYHWARTEKETAVYRKIFGWFVQDFPELKNAFDEVRLLKLVESIAAAEIDLLIESPQYFMLIEAKIPVQGKKATFRRRRGMYQMVRQMVEAALLSKIVGKQSMVATLGVEDRRFLQRLNPTEKQLLEAVGIGEINLPNVSWDLLAADGQAIGATAGE